MTTLRDGIMVILKESSQQTKVIRNNLHYDLNIIDLTTHELRYELQRMVKDDFLECKKVNGTLFWGVVKH